MASEHELFIKIPDFVYFRHVKAITVPAGQVLTDFQKRLKGRDIMISYDDSKSGFIIKIWTADSPQPVELPGATTDIENGEVLEIIKEDSLNIERYFSSRIIDGEAIYYLSPFLNCSDLELRNIYRNYYLSKHKTFTADLPSGFYARLFSHMLNEYTAIKEISKIVQPDFPVEDEIQSYRWCVQQYKNMLYTKEVNALMIYDWYCWSKTIRLDLHFIKKNLLRFTSYERGYVISF